MVAAPADLFDRMLAALINRSCIDQVPAICSPLAIHLLRVEKLGGVLAGSVAVNTRNMPKTGEVPPLP